MECRFTQDTSNHTKKEADGTPLDLPEGGEVVMDAVSMEVLSKEARNDSASSLAETIRSLAPKEEEDGASKAAKAETESNVFSLDDALSSVRISKLCQHSPSFS